MESYSEHSKDFFIKILAYSGGIILLLISIILLFNVKMNSYVLVAIILIGFYISITANQRLLSEIEYRKRAERELEYRESLFRGIFNNAAVGIALLNEEGYYRHANATLCRMTGYSEEELLRIRFEDITHTDDLEKSIQSKQGIFQGDYSCINCEKRFISKNQEVLWAEVNLSAIHGKDNEITDAIVVVNDLTVRKRMEKELLHQATTDCLTGVDNRLSFMRKTEREFNRAQRYKRDLALVLIDVDKFKDVNDHYGHLIGDRVLKDVVKACKAALRETDIIARIGGEEFAIVLLESDLETAKDAALRVQQNVSEAKVRYGDAEIQVTISMGIGIRREEDTNVDSIFKRADDALYSAKNSGRNKIVVEDQAC